jgi:hypothetical protein
MQININTDKTIERHQGLDDHVASVVNAAVGRFGEQITRVEVHLSDDNSQKSADGGNRCLLEARDSSLGRLHDKQLHKTPTLDEQTDEISK